MSDLGVSDFIRFVPWAIAGLLLIADVPGRLSTRFFPRMNHADATFLLQVLVVVGIPLVWIAAFDGPSRALNPGTITPIGVICLYLAVDWARCRIPQDGEGSRSAKTLETRYSLAILFGYIVFLGAMMYWFFTVGP